MMAQAAQDDVEDSPAAQGEQRHQFHDGKTAAFLLRGGLGIALLVLGGIGQLRGGAIGHFDGPALKLPD